MYQVLRYGTARCSLVRLEYGYGTVMIRYSTVTVWHGYGMVRYGTLMVELRYGMVQYGYDTVLRLRHGVTRQGTVSLRYGTIHFGAVWHGYGTLRYGAERLRYTTHLLVRYGMIWYGSTASFRGNVMIEKGAHVRQIMI